jgi:hypothetical protein
MEVLGDSTDRTLARIAAEGPPAWDLEEEAGLVAALEVVVVVAEVVAGGVDKWT